MENQLQVILQNSDLEETKADFILEKFHNYFDIAAEWEKKAKMIIVTDETQKADMEMARVGRLFLKEKRIAIEKARKELKEQALREGKAIDGIANVLKALIVPIEEYLEKQEKFIEFKIAAKLEQEKIEAELKLEQERIAKEKALILHNERKEKIIPYWNFIPADKRDMDFSTLTEKEWEERFNFSKAEKEKDDLKQEEIRLQNEKLKKEAEEKERQIQQERIKAEKEKQIECPFCHKKFNL